MATSVDFDQVDILDIAQELNLKLHPVQGGKHYLTHCWMCGDKSRHGKLAISPAKGVFVVLNAITGATSIQWLMTY